MRKQKNKLTLKYGTLKSWDFYTQKANELLDEYKKIGSKSCAIMQQDAQRQKEIICELIDECDTATIFLEMEGKYVSKQKAKQYVINY